MLQFCTALDIGGGSDLLGQGDAAAGSWKAGNRRAWLARMGEESWLGSH
jgi:hypothetical protein